VVELGGNREISSLRGLLAIYQQEKAWEKALDILKQLETSTGSSMHAQAAHCHCEIAGQFLKNNAADKALISIKQALSIDKKSVRASLMLANFEIKNNRYKQAIGVLKNVPEQDPDFLTEIVEPLVLCHRELESMDECVDYLEYTLAEYPRASVIFVIGDYLRVEKSVDMAIDFVSTQLGRYPSIRGLNRLIYWHLETAHGRVRDKLQMLYDITSKFLENKPIYRCEQCGFCGKLLHWQCPSCKQWSRTKPIHGLEGD
jgi:lipopolysaccharide biosynthesis regulator YciM